MTKKIYILLATYNVEKYIGVLTMKDYIMDLK